MVLAQHSNTLIHLIRTLFTVIDGVVYWALMEIYNLIDQISKINIFGEGTISEFTERIYTIIGVLMLFKLAFSIISYIVDPDKLADSKKGFSSIVKNIIIMLVLIVTVPLIFKYAMALQYVVVSDNTIGRLITGKEGGTTKNVGDNMSVAILSGFIHPDSGVAEGCENYSETCEAALRKYNLDTDYHDAYFGERGYNALLRLAASNETMGDGNFVIVYNVLLSTLVGGFAAYILLMFCIDLAVRIVKLGFLQLIAPIPIVTYMDDGGQGVFKKWVKACTSTYVDLFVRLAAIDFAIYVISVFLISDSGNNTLTGNFKMCEWTFNGGVLTANCDSQPGLFVKLFLILGTLMFAKQLPKLIEDITGLKLSNGFSLNPMKQLGFGAGLGVGALAGGITGAASSFAASRAMGGNIAKSLASGLGGAVGGTFKGGYAGAKAGGKDVLKSSMTAGASHAKNMYDNYGTPWSQRMKSKLDSAIGTDNAKYKELTKEHLGEELWDKYGNLGTIDNYDERYRELLKGNDEMIHTAGEVDMAKDRRDNLESVYKQMNDDMKAGRSFRDSNGNIRAITAKDVDDARIAWGQASGDYDKAKARLDKLKTLDAKNAARYDAYQAQADKHKYQGRITKEVPRYETFDSNQSSPSTPTTPTPATASVSAGPNPLDSDMWNNAGSIGGYGSDGEI